MAMSWERLQLLVAAKRKDRAGVILDLGQLIVAGWGSADAWSDKQKQLIERIESDL